MKTRLPSALALLLTVSLTGIFMACSKGSDEGTKVDVTAMIEQLKNSDGEMRATACTELAKAGPRSLPAVSALIPLLKDEDPVVRRLAAYALGAIGPQAKEAVPALKEALSQMDDRELMMSAVNALRAIDPASVGDVKVSTTMTGE
jgi:HEAT repeat protein